MSVWEATTYKLDIAKNIYEWLPGMIDNILGRHISCYLQPRGDLVPFEASSTWDDVATECNWEFKAIDLTELRTVSHLAKHVTSWSIGLSAVYKLILACFREKFEVQDQYRYAALESRMRALATVVVSSTMITPSSFEAEWNRADAHLLSIARSFENFSEAWKFLARGLDNQSDEFGEFDQEKYFGDGHRIYYGGSIGPLTIMVGSSEYKNQGLIMTRNHLNILIEASARISGLLDHSAREHVDNKLMKKKILDVLTMTIYAGGQSRGFNTDKVAQAFHKARAYVQMKMFGNLMANASDEALLEFQAKGLQNVMDLGGFLFIFEDLEPGRWLELLHIYKWMPPPDYDVTYSLTELQEMHDNTRPSGLDTFASAKMRTLWALVEKERKLNVAVAYRRMNGSWPTGLLIEDDSPNEASLDGWTPYDLFPYFTYGADVTNQIKDKTTVHARMEDEIAMDKDRDERNFLLWYLKNRSRIDTRLFAKQNADNTLGEDNYVRVAYKGEAHKPGSRLFFMAPPKQRILLGELEGNLARIARFYPASLQGMDALTRADKLSNLFDIYDDSIKGDFSEVFTSYIVTFDLSKFSDKFNPKVLQNLHEFWASVYAYPEIASMCKIGSKSEILHTTNNLVMHYPNTGADLQGFRGRMMTLFHADLLSAACRLAITTGCIIGRAVCAVFIDDGAVRIAAKGTGEEAHANALIFLQCMQDVYEAAGQENHPNKTIVSESGGELLAEQYVLGQRLKCPIKAGMRLYPNYENPASCITEEFDSLFATIQGSVRDGCKWVCAYRRLAEAYVKAIERWDRETYPRLNSLQFALKLVTPKSFGGFGFPSLQSLVTTTAYNNTIEGLGILNSAGRAFPSYQPLIRSIIEREVVIRDPLHILRDGERVRMDGDILIEGRLVDQIVKSLEMMGGPARELVLAYKSAELNEHARQVAIALLSAPSVSLPVLKRAWDCTPLAFVEGIVQKFKRAASIKAVIGDAGITRVRRANQKDVRKLLRNFF